MRPLFVLVLAAGQGTRMKSALPKVLHSGRGPADFRARLKGSRRPPGKRAECRFRCGAGSSPKGVASPGLEKLHYVVSGHAQRERARRTDGEVLAQAQARRTFGVYGDTPLLTAQTLQRLVDHHAVSGNAATFWRWDVPDPSVRRMILDGQGYLERIAETKMRPRWSARLHW